MQQLNGLAQPTSVETAVSRMNPSSPAVTPLRQRMIDDMRMRKLCDKTQTGYIRAVRHLAAFLGRSPDTAPSRICGGSSCTWSIKAPRRSR